MKHTKSLLVTCLLLLTFTTVFAQRVTLSYSAFSDPSISFSQLTAADQLALVVGIPVTVTLQSTNEMIGTFMVDDKGTITFNFPEGMTDPRSGIFIFEIGAGQVWSNPSLTSTNRTLTKAFTRTTVRPFVYKIIFSINAQSKGAFAVSGKNES